MLEALLRLIGIGGRREERPPVDAEEELARYNDPERARGVVTILGAPIGGNPLEGPDGERM